MKLTGTNSSIGLNSFQNVTSVAYAEITYAVCSTKSAFSSDQVSGFRSRLTLHPDADLRRSGRGQIDDALQPGVHLREGRVQRAGGGRGLAPAFAAPALRRGEQCRPQQLPGAWHQPSETPPVPRSARTPE